MRTVFSNKEVVHVWASQKQQHGKSGSIFFDGASIYSYGRHFEMARIVKSNIVFLNPDSYSVTTSGHQSQVRQATSHMTHYFVSDFNHLPTGLSSMIGNIQTLALRIKRARTNKAWLTTQLENAIEKIKDFVHDFPEAITPKNEKAYKAVLSDSGIEALVAQAETLRKQVLEDEKKEQAKRLAAQLDNLNKWLKGEETYGYYRFDDMRLRVKGDTVETTHGASVPVREARMLYKAIKAGKEIIGQRIGYYTVNSLTTDMLTVGCHRIPMSEIERISAEVLAWKKTPCVDCLSEEEHAPNCGAMVSA